MEWIARRSLISLISSIFLLRAADAITAYLVFLFKPEFFIKYEGNHWTKAAHCYGEWWKFFVPWILLIALILLFVGGTKYFKKEIFLNFLLMFFASQTIIAASTNVCGIIFDTNLPGPIASALGLSEFFSIVLVALGAREQGLRDHEKKRMRQTTVRIDN